MDDWFEERIKEALWKALNDAFGELAGLAAEAIQDKLNELTVGEVLSSSPLVAVTATTPTDITFILRGRIKLFGGAVSPFVRIELAISKMIPADLDPPITVTDWHTVIGDLRITNKGVFAAELGFGWDRGVWLGRGMFKILPAGFGLDILLGGLSDRGLMVGIDTDFPAPIPLGSTGLGLAGVGGDFAYNFVARLEKAGIPIASPTAADYVTWARNAELDRWDPGPEDETAIGTAIRADLITLLDNGYLVKLVPIGLAVLIPGPVFVLGGKGELLRTSSAKVEGYVVVDLGSSSFALGLGVQVKVPNAGDLILLHAQGRLDALFSFADASLWYVNFGTNSAPVKGKVLQAFDAEVFLMLNNDRVLFGAGISIGGSWKFAIVKLTARIGARVAALVGWNPQELEGAFKFWGEVGVKVWKIGISLLLEAEAIGHTPRPTQLDLTVRYKVNLPWPVPDVKGSKTLSLPDVEPEPPELISPLLSGTWVVGDDDPEGPMALGAVHHLTGRQWQLDKTTEAAALWPDAEIVIPFTRRVTDETGTVIGPVVAPEVHGGYAVQHRLTKVELRDLVTDTLVTGVGAVWASGPGGDSARLHVLGQDPFAWLSPHVDTVHSASVTPPAVIEQRFGIGPPSVFSEKRRFGDVVVHPDGTAALLTSFAPELPTRVLRCSGLELAFTDAGDAPRPVDWVALFVITSGGEHEENVQFEVSDGTTYGPYPIADLAGDLSLSLLVVVFASPVSAVQIGAEPSGMLVYAIRYRRAETFSGSATSKTVLTPSRYRLTLEGASTASFPGDELPAASPVTWTAEENFWVGAPETLRPYIRSTTVGDNRLFLSEPAWNPTMFGTGFPLYRDYRPVVSFLVPYVDEIFTTILVRIGRETEGVVELAVAPAPNPDGESSLPAKSQSWIAAHGGTVTPDQELVFTSPLPPPGPAAVTLAHALPGGEERRLDGWGTYISQFLHFRAHVGWTGHSITTWYDPSGRHVRPACPTVASGSGPKTVVEIPDWLVGASRIDSLLGGGKRRRLAPMIDIVPSRRSFKAERGAAAIREDADDVAPPGGAAGSSRLIPGADVGPLLADPQVGFRPFPPLYPEERTTPPADWVLPSSMTQHLGPLGEDTAVSFLRFARDSAARFNDGAGDRMAGIGNPAAETTIEAVTDAAARPLCLWIRTLEPLDWRRVETQLEIRHVVQTGPCPTAYAYRRRLNLDVEILPSHDATSAFLVGTLNGVRTRLPRGEYRLTLTFDPATTGLARLRPSAAVGAVPETITLTFLQPLGQDWPPPTSPIDFLPPEVLELFPKKWWIDPTDPGLLLPPDAGDRAT